MSKELRPSTGTTCCIHTEQHRSIEVLNHTSQEEGCVYIHGYQERQNPNTFRIQSCWKSQRAFDAHINTEHVQQFGERTKDMKDEPGEMFITDRIV